jgi:hypothetical protein
MVICPVCASPGLRGQLNADVVRRLTLSSIAQKHGLSSRAVRRHVAHLPERLDADASASRPTLYIGTVNVSVFVPPHEEENGGTADDPRESIATEGGRG